MKSRVLIVDDERELALILKDFLENEGIESAVALNGHEAATLLESFKPTLVILDIMLPDDDGMEICRKIRNKSDIPIIMLSAKNADVDKIISLGLGADEYLTKPFSGAVVVAHVKALLRRYRTQTNIEHKNIVIYKNFFMDLKKHKIQIDEKDVNLVGKEFELLWFLANHPSEVFAKEQLYDEIWGEDEFGEISTVTVHIRKIRSKIQASEDDNRFIKTIWGVGYKFEEE